ncbi:MAG: helix-turn-helix transcriptional regulator [Clostridia bacterium]|nr:helix-turn-helix transcriptional regulator [Clostridia bacterium]
MFNDMENLKIIAIHKGALKKRKSEGICREFHAFILRISGCVRYSFAEKSVDLHAGEMIFVPKGVKYDYAAMTDQPCEYITLRFDARLSGERWSKHPFDGFSLSDEYINKLSELWKLGGRTEHYKCYSIFYELVSYLENLESLSYADKQKTNMIAPAITYMKKHIYDSELRVETLIKLCGISGVYFNKLFCKVYGVSPQKYISERRLSHAKTMIDTGDFGKISEVAAAAGFDDPLYFSRAFKKRYGVSPAKYAASEA